MSNLLSGIFNYCDRWCERCDYRDRCRLFQSETDRNIQHILNGEDPNNPEIAARDIKESLEDALEMLKSQMDVEETIAEDFQYLVDNENEDSQYYIDNFDDERFEVAESGKIAKTQHPLTLLADVFFKGVVDWYGKIKLSFAQNYDTVKPIDDPLHEELKILMWYSPQISVKIRMCAGSASKLENEKDEDKIEFETEMMNINSRIAFTGMEKCLTSLQKIYDLETEHRDDIFLLLTSIKKMKDKFEKVFPAVHTFKRPYFD